MTDYFAQVGNNPEAAFKAANAIVANTAERSLEIQEYWNLFVGDHASMLQPYEGETDTEYSRRMSNLVIENHCAQTVYTVAAMLYGKPPRREILDNPRANDLYRKILDYNHISSLQLIWGMIVSIAGFAPIRLLFVDVRTREPFDPEASQEDKRRYGMIEFQIEEPALSSVIIHPRDPRRMWGIIFSGKEPVINEKGDIENVDILEYIGYQYWFRWYNERFEPPVPGGKNPFSTPEIPIVLLSNGGDPMSPIGESDLKDMKALQLKLDEIQTDLYQILHYHSSPILKFRNCAAPTGFIRKPNSAIEIDSPDGDVEYLVWNFDLSGAMEFLESMRKNMRYSVGISDISRGILENLGNLRSGIAVDLTFLSDKISLIRKKAALSYGEEWLARSALRMWEIYTGEALGDYRFIIEFDDMLTDLDRVLRLQEEMLELQTGVKGIVDMILERHPELTRQEAIQFLKDNLDTLRMVQSQPGVSQGQVQPSSGAKKSVEQVQ